MFTLTRKGEFTLRTHGQYHCGTLPVMKCRYTFVVQCTGLDQRGFLFDQTGVQRFFDGVKTSSLSCERFTQASLDHLVRRALAENDRLQIQSANLTLSPEPFLAELTSAWEPRHVR
jgi:hypothetical protein